MPSGLEECHSGTSVGWVGDGGVSRVGWWMGGFNCCRVQVVVGGGLMDGFNSGLGFSQSERYLFKLL